ncbi:MAG: carboxy terminal-processing peptidase [Lentisphaerae bacterium]|nr:carboxy terminal-processing peptidase [Lentisphaerota bacterium]
MQEIRHHMSLAALLALCCLPLAGRCALPDPAAPASEEASKRYGRVAERFASRIPSTHLMRLPMGDTVSERAWTNLLTSLDFDHLFFLQSDIDEFSAQRDMLDDAIKEGDLSFAYDVFERYKLRVDERLEYVETLLDSGFDLTLKEVYAWNRRDAPWAATREECAALWRLKIKNEYLRQVVSRTLAEEIKIAEEEAAAHASPTSAVPDIAIATNAMETIADELTSDSTDMDLSPEASIRKRYAQLRSMLHDSDREWLVEKYLTAFARAYDPHSGYMSPSSVEDFDIEMKLSLVGIGALLRTEDGAAKIVRLIPGGPAAKDKHENRLRAGDKIIAVGQEPNAIVDVLHWPLHKIVDQIRGEKATRVYLTVIPASDPSGSSTKLVVLERDEVKLQEQAADSEIRDIQGTDGEPHRFGVITLPAFYASMSIRDKHDPQYKSASEDVRKILVSLEGEGVEGVILDLRSNGGGSLVEAIRMTGLFIRSGPTVQVRERHSIRVLPDRDPSVAYHGPLVVLVNALSASASEIVAGALQDYGRALIVGGKKTHGKGSVQTILSLNNDGDMGSLRVTTASYYRITGDSTQLRGITPDIIIHGPADYMKLGEDALPNPMPWSAVMPARFVPVADLDGVKQQLRDASNARRAANPRFDAYNQLLRRIEALNETEELPLDLEGRMALARSETELAKIQESLIPEGGDKDPEGASQADLVMEETLLILSDFAATKYATASLQAEQSDEQRNPLMNMLEQWLNVSP